MDSVTEIVNGVLDAKGWRGKILERLAVELWPEVVGEWIAPHTIAESFRNGTLYVRARSPQWTHELHFHEDRIITRLNGRLRQPIVRKIRVSVTPPPGVPKSRLKKDWEDPTFPAAPPRSKQTVDRLEDEASIYARDLTAPIADEELRAVMTRYITSVIRCRRDDQGVPADQRPRLP